MQADKHHQTGDDVSHLGLKMFYRNAFKQATQALEFSGKERHLGGMTMAISEEGYGKIVWNAIGRFWRRFERSWTRNDHADRVAQMLFALYPLTRQTPQETKETQETQKS